MIICIYICDLKNSTRELLNLINSFSAVAGYKIYSNKSVAFLYTKDKQAEKEIRETTPFTIVTNNIKYLGVTLTKQVKDLDDKNFKSLKKEIEEDLRRWKDLPCSWIGGINIVKMATLRVSCSCGVLYHCLLQSFLHLLHRTLELHLLFGCGTAFVPISSWMKTL